MKTLAVTVHTLHFTDGKTEVGQHKAGQLQSRIVFWALSSAGSTASQWWSRAKAGSGRHCSLTLPVVWKKVEQGGVLSKGLYSGSWWTVSGTQAGGKILSHTRHEEPTVLLRTCRDRCRYSTLVVPLVFSSMSVSRIICVSLSVHSLPGDAEHFVSFFVPHWDSSW